MLSLLSIFNFFPPHYSSAFQVIGRKFNCDGISWKYTNLVHFHFTGQVAYYDVIIFQFYPKNTFGGLDNCPFNF